MSSRSRYRRSMTAPPGVTSRVQREAEFHDERIADDSARAGVGKFYATVANAHEQWLTTVQQTCAAKPGARVLEVGCSSGQLARQLGLQNVQYTGIDVSHAALISARMQQPDDAVLRVDAHQMAFADASFDVVFGRGVLHHLDTAVIASELGRIVRPGGTVIFQEPMGHNALINKFRDRTPEMRTSDEHPLLMDDIDAYSAAIGPVDTKWFGAAAVATAPLQGRPGIDKLTRFLMQVDQVAFDRIPMLGRYAWIANLTMTRR